MSATMRDGRRFEISCELLDVTSNHRPDPSWSFTDKSGHVHRWYEGDSPATAYRPEASYSLPTLVCVVDDEGIDEDGCEFQRAHFECAQCGDHVTPGHTADTYQQFIPGPRRCAIDLLPVSPEVFEAELTKARQKA